MISHLGISGLGVIRAAEVDLSPGLVVFTGETGAGKTMVVSALGLVLGDRFDSGLLGTAGTRVEATLDAPGDSAALDRVREAGGDVADDGEVIIGRLITAGGRGRAVAGGATVPLSVLSELGDSVAQRHSQSDQIGLRSARAQRHALDRFAGADLAEAVTDYRDRYGNYLHLSGRLAEVVRTERERATHLETLRADLAAIDAVGPDPATDEHLDVAIGRLANAEVLHEQLTTAAAAVTGDDEGAVAALGLAADALDRITRHDPTLTALHGQLLALQEQAAELGRDLTDRVPGVAADPAELARLQARKAALGPLLRRFGPTFADLLARREQLATQVAGVADGAAGIAQLRHEVAEALSGLAASATRLSQIRRSAAARLSEQVTAELAGLAMPQATFSVTVDRRDDAAGLRLADGSSVAFGESGIDVVRFLLAPHAGAAPAPIGDGASGGELSRIMLALEVVLASTSPPGVFIFDEVDAGIGGRTAVEVGRRLARLAERSQVLVVTHLAQVAAFADQHIVVRKDSDGMVTATSVSEVTGAERTTELSRMLSGQDGSAAAQAHAAELLDLAALEARPG